MRCPRLRPLAWLVGLAVCLAVPSAGAGPAMDPARMSGMPRPDPQLRPGVITVRCLLGSFDRPAAGITVTLAIEAVDGRTSSREAVTGAEGRAEFGDLKDLIGATAIATAELGGQVLRTQPMVLHAEAGTRVMLVKPNAAAAAPAPAGAGGAAPHGGSAAGHGGSVPSPGKPFPLSGRPPGTIVAGTLDLRGGGKPVTDLEVTLTITPPSGAPFTKVLRSDKDGRAVFGGLQGDDYPNGTTFQIAAPIVAGQPAVTSEAFELGETAIAVVLTAGDVGGGSVAGGTAAPRRAKLPGPRIVPSLASGVVLVRLVDGDGKPVSEQAVQVVRKDVTGKTDTYRGVTGADGRAKVEAKVAAASHYFVGVVHDGAPYQSGFFELHDGAGVAVDMRVFPSTSDLSVVRSAASYELRGRENDQLEVRQDFEVLVAGDRAYWPAGGLRIEGAEGAHGLVVVGNASRWLEHKDGEPFAKLAGPIPPGEVVSLSVAYLVSHDGSAEFRWQSPFALQDFSVVLPEGMELVEPEGVAPETSSHSGTLRRFSLGERPIGAPVEFDVAGMPARPRVFVRVAQVLSALMGLGLLIGLVTAGREHKAVRLVARRDALLAKLDTELVDEERARVIAALDRVYRALDKGGGTP